MEAHVNDRAIVHILAQAEVSFGGMTLAQERASCGSWPAPVNAGNYLMWWLDERDLQASIASSEDGELAFEAGLYADIIKVFCDALKSMGIVPTAPYWER